MMQGARLEARLKLWRAEGPRLLGVQYGGRGVRMPALDVRKASGLIWRSLRCSSSNSMAPVPSLSRLRKSSLTSSG